MIDIMPNITENLMEINNNTSHSNDQNVIVNICIHLVMPCAVAIGIIGNLLSILVFARREMIKFCVSIFTIVLAFSDILLLTTSVFNIILPDFLGGLLSDRSAFWCHFHGYFDLLFAALSGYSMVFISIERWFSVWKPFDKAKYVTFRTTIIAVVSYTSVSIINFSWFPLTLKYSPNDGESPETCAMQRPTVYKVFGTISVVFTYIIPSIFLGILNSMIVYRLHVRQNTSAQRGMTMSSSNVNESNSVPAQNRKRQKQRNVDRNITFMLIAVAIAFMIMSLPYQIYWFYMQIRQISEPNKILFTLTQTFRYLNCCCNFFLYSATSSLFRRELREIFKCSNDSKKNQKHLNGENNNVPARTRAHSSLTTNFPVTTIEQDKLEKRNLLVKSADPSSVNRNVTSFGNSTIIESDYSKSFLNKENHEL